MVRADRLLLIHYIRNHSLGFQIVIYIVMITLWFYKYVYNRLISHSDQPSTRECDHESDHFYLIKLHKATLN